VKVLIEARGPDREPVGIVTGWTEAHLVARHNDIGTWSVTIPLADVPPAVLEAWTARGWAGVRIVDEDQHDAPPIITGPITTDADKWGADDPHGGTITVSGVSDLVILRDRLIYPDPGEAWEDQDPNAYRRVPTSGKQDAETVIRTLVLENLGADALTARRVAGFTVEANLTRGEDVRSATKAVNLWDRVQRLAMLGGLGVRIDQETTGALTMRFYEPTLRVNVLLSSMAGTVLGGTASVEAPTVTRALVAGQTAAVELGAPDTEVEWARRIEVLVDQRSTTDADDLDQAAAEALAGGAARGAWQANVQDGSGAVYGVDYGLGDVVGVDVRGTEVRDVVREVTIDVTAEGAKVGPVVGPVDASSAPALYRRVRSLERRLRELQAGA
jgi:hypothetical protein